jgi:hypothetical protein
MVLASVPLPGSEPQAHGRAMPRPAAKQTRISEPSTKRPGASRPSSRRAALAWRSA